MAARSSSSSDPNSTREKSDGLYSSDYRVSEVTAVGVQGTTTEAERSSFLGQLNNSQKKTKAIINGGELDEIAGSIECVCCYWEYPPENMVACPNGHRFCFKCITRQIDEIIYGGLKAHGSLFCTAIDNCKESIPLSEIRRAIPNDVVERYEHRQAEQSIVDAKIQDLVYCPFCNVPYEIDKCLQVLDCPNPKCLKASCIQCKKLSHSPLGCEEVETISETALRREVEERMTKAVIRECNICRAQLIKTSGCNSVRCRCGNTMCYVCRHTITDLLVPHFCHCPRYIGERGKPCQICNRCNYIENEIEDNEAEAAREHALKELVDRKPELVNLKIGPPLKRLGRQHDRQLGNMAVPRRLPWQKSPSELANILANNASKLKEIIKKKPELLKKKNGAPLKRVRQRPQNRITPLPEVSVAKMAVPPPQFLGHNHQVRNMAVRSTQFLGLNHQMRNRGVHPPQFFGVNHQIRNTGVRPPGVNHQIRNMGVRPPGVIHQIRNMGVRPPQVLAPNHQTQNMGVRSPQFLGLNHQLRNIAVPQPLPTPEFLRSGNQLENSFGNQEASKEFVHKKRQLPKLEIGPPLQRLRRQPPTEQQGHQLGNMVVPQSQFLGHDEQLANMDLPQRDYGSEKLPKGD